VLEGTVPETLETHAAEVSAEVVVMASHGRGPLSRAWLGSVADHFVRHGPSRVLLVRPDEDRVEEEIGAAHLPTWHPRTVLLPLDGSEFSAAALPDALRLARAFDAELLLVQVVAYPLEVGTGYMPQSVQVGEAVVQGIRSSAERALADRAAALEEDGLRVKTAVTTDHQAAHGILTLADEHGADVIVMATHGRGGLARALVGSTTDKVVRGTDRPVWLHRPDGARGNTEPSDPIR
jgi:nucleotide-binding universal stress UspA family protein